MDHHNKHYVVEYLHHMLLNTNQIEKKIFYFIKKIIIQNLFTSSHGPVDQRTVEQRALLNEVHVCCSIGIGCGHLDLSMDRPS